MARLVLSTFSMITANCRDTLSAEDFDFVVRTLSRSRESAVSLQELLCDAETRDTILDHEHLVTAVLRSGDALRISPQFYFYILTRHVLIGAGIESRDLSDYVASLLAAQSRAMDMTSPDGTLRTEYLSDLLLALRGASPRKAFLIRAHIGDVALFVTGIFHERIEKRRQRGAPSFSFYEDIGRSCYHDAAQHRVAREWRLDAVYGELAERFITIRSALNRLSDELISLDEPSVVPGLDGTLST